MVTDRGLERLSQRIKFLLYCFIIIFCLIIYGEKERSVSRVGGGENVRKGRCFDDI